jgi:ribosome-binding factor A
VILLFSGTLLIFTNILQVSIRQNQIAELIRRNFSLVLQEQGRYIFEGDALVTVTNVRMSPDLGLAKIYLSVYNTDNKQAVILSMNEEKKRLKQSLDTRLRKQMRRMPEIDFYLDDTLDEMYRLNALFHQLHREGQMGEEE